MTGNNRLYANVNIRTHMDIVTGEIITGATLRVPLNTALRPRPVGPAVHTAQKLSPSRSP